LEDVGMDGRMILMNLTEIGWEVHLSQDGDQWPNSFEHGSVSSGSTI